MPHIAPRPGAAARKRVPLLFVLLALLSFTGSLTRSIPTRAAGPTPALTRSGDILTLANDAASVRYNLATGLMDLSWLDRGTIERGYATVFVGAAPDPALVLRSTDLTHRVYETRPVDDALGRGLRLLVSGENTAAATTLTQSITLYDGRPDVLLRVEAARTAAAHGDPLETARIEVLGAGGITAPPGRAVLTGPDAGRDPRLYRVPFDNDGDLAIPPAPSLEAAVSYWLAALFDGAAAPGSGSAIVAGATESRDWKNAVWWDGPTSSLSVFSGVQSPADTMPPVARRGTGVASAEFLVGGYADVRDGLTALMTAVGRREPPLPEPPLPPPLGWNPWYQYGFRADARVVTAIADFLAGSGWADLGYRYVNLDAGWNVMDGDWRPNPERFPDGMAALAGAVHDRGLLAGTYLIPFAVHPDMLDQPAPGTPYLFRDLVLRDATGAPVPADILSFDDVLDASHPGTLDYLRYTGASMAADGFDFIKLDFLQIGTQEGMRFDPTVTAMQAFHRGMAALTEGLRRGDKSMYVSAAISPLYVQPYVHARRVGTDVNFGQERQAGNVALSWFTDLLYARNDPDNVVVRDGWYPEYSDGMARLHATMDALGGTLFILGDDPRFLSPERAALLTVPAVLALAREGVAARPLDVGETPAPVWSARLRDGSVVAGVFNWGDAPAGRILPLARLGLDPAHTYHVRDLWRGDDDPGTAVAGSYAVSVPPRTAALLRFSR